MAIPSRTCQCVISVKNGSQVLKSQLREIYRNETDFNKKGSLLWILDRTTTRFGARMLKSWIGRPITDTTYELFFPTFDVPPSYRLIHGSQRFERADGCCRRNHSHHFTQDRNSSPAIEKVTRLGKRTLSDSIREGQSATPSPSKSLSHQKLLILPFLSHSCLLNHTTFSVHLKNWPFFFRRLIE